MKIVETYLNGILVRNMIEDEDDFSTQEQKDNWLSICNQCNKNNNGQCSECGCVILTKTIYKDSHCPINKW